MSKKYDIETPYKPMLEEPDTLPPLPKSDSRPNGDLLDALYQDEILQKDKDDDGQARKTEPGFAPGVPSPAPLFDDIDPASLPAPFSPQALKKSIGLLNQAESERQELLTRSLSRLDARIKQLEENRKRLMGWELNNPDAAHRISSLERLVTSLEDKAEDRRTEFWKSMLPLREKRLALEEELAEAEQLEKEISKIVWTD
jgi:hypothetical protein